MGKTTLKRFDPTEPHALSSVGWDAWAEEYAELPRKVYSNKIDIARQKAVTQNRSWTAGRYLELYERL